MSVGIIQIEFLALQFQSTLVIFLWFWKLHSTISILSFESYMAGFLLSYVCVILKAGVKIIKIANKIL